MKLIPATKDEFDQFLKDNPLAVPDGFSINGSLIQANYILNGKIVARDSWDSGSHLYDITDK